MEAPTLACKGDAPFRKLCAEDGPEDLATDVSILKDDDMSEASREVDGCGLRRPRSEKLCPTNNKRPAR